jgi:tetratricopeptide (TPR) repeat protein
MERHRKLDFAGAASGGSPLNPTRAAACLFVLVILSTLLSPAFGQSPSGDGPLVEEAKSLTAAQRWQEVVSLLQSSSPRSADLDYYYGSALAHLERWQDAHIVLQQGARLRPQDARFPLELAGVAFKQKRYSAAAAYLRRAATLAPNDPYTNEFLATVYFLQGNLEAALKYWNRVSKPQIAGVRLDPIPHLDPVLLDHALAFSPAGALLLPDLLTTQTWVHGLGIFPTFNFDLSAREDGRFDLALHNHERNGFGQTKLEALVRLFSNLPAQEINPEYFNLRHEAINIISLYRWDAQKRRAHAEVSAPWTGPRRRFFLGGDWRDENWDIRNSFTGQVPLLGSLSLEREAAEVGVTFFPSGRWRWSAGAEFSHRDFANVFSGTALTPALLSQGYQLKQLAEVNADLWRIPDHRLIISSGISSQAGRIWSSPAHAFEKLQAEARFHWFPRGQGDDYEMQELVRAGKTWGTFPFDELFMLGGLGDNNLMMRGHITTHDGRKGSGPLGRNYVLSNWELDKNIFHNGLFAVKLGPFMDTGKITDPSPGLGSHQWLYDTGGQLKLKAFGLGVALTYGKDLRSGSNAFFINMLER